MQNDWSLATFKEKFAKGEIHDFKPWMENGPKGIRYVMAKNGIEIEELLKEDDYGIILRLIEHGYAKEHWESWKEHPYSAVRLSLALKGLWPEHYLNDPDEHVRHASSSAIPNTLFKVLSEVQPNGTQLKTPFVMTLMCPLPPLRPLFARKTTGSILETHIE